jgi:hypothetical protein
MLTIGSLGVLMKCAGVEFTTHPNTQGSEEMVVLIPDDGAYRHIGIADAAGNLLCTLHLGLVSEGQRLNVAVATAASSTERPELKAVVYGPFVSMTPEHGQSMGRSEAAFPDAQVAEIHVSRAPVDEAVHA